MELFYMMLAAFGFGFSVTLGLALALCLVSGAMRLYEKLRYG